MRKWATCFVLSMLMLAGTGIAYYVELNELNIPGFLSIAVELLIVVCLFGWLLTATWWRADSWASAGCLHLPLKLVSNLNNVFMEKICQRKNE